MNHLLRRAWPKLRTIRVRLTLWYVALLSVILAAFSVFLYVNLSRSLHDEVDRSLRSEAQRLIATLDIEDGQPRLGDGPDNLQVGTVAALYDPTGQRLLANDPRQPLPAMAEALSWAVQGQQTLTTIRFPDRAAWRVLTTPVVENGRLVAVLQVARPERDLEATLGQLMMLMALAVPLTLLLAIAGGIFLAGRALNPIDRITRMAAAISAEDLSQRLNLGGDDEVGRLGATFDRMLDRLETAFQRQRQFTADASHELRTPLTMLRGRIDVALERRRSATEYVHILVSLREDTDRMGQLLGDLLTLARADAGQEPLVREWIDLNGLAEHVVTAMQPLARQRGLDLQREEGGAVPVEGDQTRLMQLLVNLVDNALKYTPSGGAVMVSAGQEAGWGMLRIADTGIGIAPEHLPHLFERFYRVDKARARPGGGTGLGLAICSWIAEAHGGTIGVESQPGVGTTFTVRLPLASHPAPSALATRRGGAGWRSPTNNEAASSTAVRPPSTPLADQSHDRAGTY